VAQDLLQAERVPPIADIYEEQPAKRRHFAWKKSLPNANDPPKPSSVSEPKISTNEHESSLEAEGDDDSGRQIDDIPREDIREALRHLVPKGLRIEREDLLKKLATALGQQRLGRKIRSRLNRAIGGEARAGNLETDWDFVWRTPDTGP